MISRVIAEFDSRQAAQFAVTQAKNNIGYVYSGSIVTSPGSRHHRSGLSYPLNTHADFLSAVVPDSYTMDNEIHAGEKYSACIICGSGAVENVVSMLHALGAENIRSTV